MAQTRKDKKLYVLLNGKNFRMTMKVEEFSQTVFIDFLESSADF